jgi:hypothetical protein
MPFLNYTQVVLLTDKYSEEGVGAGSIGYIIEVYTDQDYEVEFSNQEGITIAQIVVGQDEIASADSLTSNNADSTDRHL